MRTISIRVDGKPLSADNLELCVSSLLGLYHDAFYIMARVFQIRFLPIMEIINKE